MHTVLAPNDRTPARASQWCRPPPPSCPSPARNHRKRGRDGGGPGDAELVGSWLRQAEAGGSSCARERYASLLGSDPESWLAPRLERAHWKRLSSSLREEVGRCLGAWLNRQSPHHRLVFEGLARGLPVFRGGEGLSFVLVLGGTYRRGMSCASRERLAEGLRGGPRGDPVLREILAQHLRAPPRAGAATTTTTRVAPFLLATTTLSWDSCQRTALRGHRLPTEAEWEYAARGGGWDLLFPYDCRIPGGGAAGTPALDPNARNALGLRELAFRPELCSVDHHGDGCCWRGGGDVGTLLYHRRTSLEHHHEGRVRLVREVFPPARPPGTPPPQQHERWCY